MLVDIYKEVLPSEAPPSYRGSALKYSYKITIGAQRLGSQTKLIRLPFRVLLVPGNILVLGTILVAGNILVPGNILVAGNILVLGSIL